MDVIGPLQLRVMNYIWANGPSTVHAVHDALNAEPGAPKLAYTTILTVMRNLARRGIVNQKPNGRSHIFDPVVDDKAYKLNVLQQVRRDLFGGDVIKLLAMLGEDKEIPPKKRSAINNLVG